MSNETCMYCNGNCPNEPEDSEYLCDGFAGDIDGLYAKRQRLTDLLKEKLTGTLMNQPVTPELLERAAEVSRKILQAAWPEVTVTGAVTSSERPDEITVTLTLTPKD